MSIPLGRVLPLAPMSRIYRDRLLASRVYPPTENTATWKHECVRAVVINDSYFQIAVERRGGYGLPLHVDTHHFAKTGLAKWSTAQAKRQHSHDNYLGPSK
jgi:hypothetical protein